MISFAYSLPQGYDFLRLRLPENGRKPVSSKQVALAGSTSHCDKQSLIMLSVAMVLSPSCFQTGH